MLKWYGEKKVEILKNKRKLKGKYDDVYISEDLTKLRSRMMYALRHEEDISYVNTRGGKIFCAQKLRSGKEKKFKIESPDDLFQLGWNEEKIEKLNLITN